MQTPAELGERAARHEGADALRKAAMALDATLTRAGTDCTDEGRDLEAEENALEPKEGW